MKTSTDRITGNDLRKLIEVVGSLLPASPDARRNMVDMALADLPPTTRRNIATNIEYAGAQADVASAIVLKVRQAGKPVHGRHALGYLIQGLAPSIADPDVLEWLSNIFATYDLWDVDIVLRRDAHDVNGGPRPIRNGSFQADFAIIAIREDEYGAVLDKLPPTGEYRCEDRRFATCSLPLPGGGEYNIAMLRCLEQGGLGGNAAATAAILDVNPQWIVLVGIGGAVPSTEYTLGDVVTAMRLYDFSVRAVSETADCQDHIYYDQRGGPMHVHVQDLLAQLPAMERSGALGSWNSPEAVGIARPRVTNRPRNRYGDENWRNEVKHAIDYHFKDNPRSGPIVTSRGVAASDTLVKNAELLAEWQRSARHVGAVEMELHGVYAAVHNSMKDIPILAIRGISDVVGFRRDSAWTEYACRTAASFARACLLTRPIEPRVVAARSLPSRTSTGGLLSALMAI
jgi:nucleoside phosphorylase